MSGRVRVLYIAGNGRSGSTVLDVLLGQLPGFFAAGELRRIWERGLLENRPCGCGEPFDGCPTWRAILREAFGPGGVDLAQAARLCRLTDRLTQTKRLPALAWRHRRGLPPPAAARDLASALDRLYAAIPRVTGCRIVADASKWPTSAILADGLPSVELSVLHLVRDPRAVAFSWSRRKEYEPGRLLPRQGALRSTAYWLAWNAAIRWLWDRPGRHYLRVPYERFAERPREWVERIAAWMGEPLPLPAPPAPDGAFDLRPTHALAGNAARLFRGPLSVRLDDAWRDELPAAQRWLITALTWPWLLRPGLARPGESGSSGGRSEGQGQPPDPRPGAPRAGTRTAGTPPR